MKIKFIFGEYLCPSTEREVTLELDKEDEEVDNDLCYLENNKGENVNSYFISRLETDEIVTEFNYYDEEDEDGDPEYIFLRVEYENEN